MNECIKLDKRLKVIVEDKYFKNDIVQSDDTLVSAAIKCLKDIGKSCEYFGINSLGGHVVLIDGVKYCTSGIALLDSRACLGNAIAKYIADFICSITKNQLINDTLKTARAEKGLADIRVVCYEIFNVVEDLDHDYRQNYLKVRVNKIMNEINV